MLIHLQNLIILNLLRTLHSVLLVYILTFRNKYGIIFIENKKRGIAMKFIHAIVFDKTEYENLREYGVDFESWGDITEGDYIVHCLYDVDNEKILVQEDNTHQPVETIIETFLKGIEYGNSINVGGIMIPNEANEVIKAYIIVNKDQSSYSSDAVRPHFINKTYVEVED